jgi:hypothetical protein
MVAAHPHPNEGIEGEGFRLIGLAVTSRATVHARPTGRAGLVS